MLVAYQRSGSSFTGELLASGGSTIYTFEPLFPWRRRLGPSADPALLRDAARLLGDMLDCRPEVIRKWQEHKFYYFRKKPADVKDFCKDASIRILKTIRARASFLLPWLAKRQDVKVIHLVRDPRGILSSVKRGQQLWSDNNRDIALQCANIKGDLSLETLGPQRYLRVEYEDLVDKQMEVTRLMFSFLGVPVTPSVEEFVKEHTHQDPDPTPVPQRYLNTYRDSGYRHDHWRNELDGLEVQHIQTVCREVMNLLHYPFVSPS
ncbi:carbohydrate sulfotransferase 3-like [Eriocheir sinensis]|uniref:carbohydrate sulfotransferase 3-like n=1 Tax=Eriocheir sinensis TaxID=95602 RepID=UPI0021C7B673|nr:carbohydrate sulfotransferase 3-like [Eriocheir sinensis]